MSIEQELMRQDMYAQLTKKPDDWPLRLVLSDLLLEMGRLNEARFQRWIVERQSFMCFPREAFLAKVYGQTRSKWCWVSETLGFTRQSYFYPCILPDWLFAKVVLLGKRAALPGWAYFHTELEARTALQKVLDEVSHDT